MSAQLSTLHPQARSIPQQRRMHRNGGSLVAQNKTGVGPMNWYCLHTRPQSERFVAEQLGTQLGLEVYLPTIRLNKTIRRVRREVVESLFPRYLFCRCDLATDYRAVRYTRDVLDLVSFGTQPVQIDDTLIAQLKNWASSAAPAGRNSAFAAGDRVEITFGPMQGLHAIILDAHDDRERVAVLLSILGAEARVTIDRSLLAKTA